MLRYDVIPDDPTLNSSSWSYRTMRLNKLIFLIYGLEASRPGWDTGAEMIREDLGQGVY